MLFLSERLRDPRIPGKILFNEDENAHLPLHWHTNVEICYFLQGGFRARVDSQCYDVQNQQLILVNSGQLHYVGENSVGDHRGISLVADMNFWQNLCPDLDALEFDLSICPERISELKNLMTHLYEASRVVPQMEGEDIVRIHDDYIKFCQHEKEMTGEPEVPAFHYNCWQY